MTKSKLHFREALLADGWAERVAIEIDGDGLISSISRDDRDSRVSFTGIAVPGMANVHSHAHQRAMVGLAERSGKGADSFWTWRETMYDFVLKMEPDELEAVAAQLYVETLKAGFTSIGEFQYLHHQPDGQPYATRAEMTLRCLAAAETAGLAITALPTLYVHGGFGEQPATEGQRRFINTADQFGDILETLNGAIEGHLLRRLGMSPHSLRAVSQPVLEDALAALDGLAAGAPVHVHVAEQVREVDDCVEWSGLRPVELLLDRHRVDERWCLIHATHMTDEETKVVAASGAVAGLCPTTEANLGDGIFNARAFQDHGGRMAIGSDSHIEVSVAGDLRQLEYSQRLKHLARNVLAGGPDRSTGRTLFEATARDGAASIAQPAGSFETGKRADIVVLDEDHPALIGRQGDSVLDSWIFSGGNPCVRDVFVAGNRVVEGGHHVREAQILATFRGAVDDLGDRM